MRRPNLVTVFDYILWGFVLAMAFGLALFVMVK